MIFSAPPSRPASLFNRDKHASYFSSASKTSRLFSAALAQRMLPKACVLLASEGYLALTLTAFVALINGA